MWSSAIEILVGFAALAIGGELLVRGAARLAQLAGISTLVIGLTVVAFGTSAPELAVTIHAGWANQADIAVGNVIGSNIFNVLFILGISALVSPLLVSRQLIRRDVPIMIGVSILALAMGADGSISRWDGLALFGGLLLYTIGSVHASRRERQQLAQAGGDSPPDPPTPGSQTWITVAQFLLVVAGLVVLVLGARMLVSGAVSVARLLGMSELLIGLTIVAVGTSLPEVAASVIATLRGERDIAIGNVVGSNIFNILSVLGLGAAVSPQGLAVSDVALRFDMPVMVAVAVLCLPLFITNRMIARWEGVFLLVYYILYTVYLVLHETRPDTSVRFATLVVWGVLPATLLLLAVNLTLSVLSGEHTDAEVDHGDR